MGDQMQSKAIFFLLIVFVLLMGCTSKKVIMIPQPCPPAHLFAHTNDTLSVIVNDWRNITFDQEQIELIVGVTHDATGRFNYSFNITDSGIYKIQYYAIFTDNSASPTADIASRVIKNGIEVNGSVFEVDATRQNAEIEMSNTIHVRIIAGDSIALQFISSDSDVSLQTHSTFGIHPDSATITMTRISCD